MRYATMTAALVVTALAAPAIGQPELTPVEIEEWQVPYEQSRPRDPDVGPDGMIWFVGQRGNYVASLDPESGDFEKIDLPEGAGPHNLIVADDGTIWYAGNRDSHVGYFTPHERGQDDHDHEGDHDIDITKIAMPDERARDPHTLIFDEAGDVWFTVQGGNFVGFLDTETEEVQLIDVPTERARPYGIRIAEDGTVWADLFGSNKLASVDPQTMELTEHALPREDARPRRLGITSDGRIWYGDYAKGFVGVFDPETEEFTEWPMPAGEESRPYAVTVDGEDRIWLVETGISPNRFVAFDTGTESFTHAGEVPSGGGTVRHMVFDEDENVIWFGADTNTVGRVTLP